MTMMVNVRKSLYSREILCYCIQICNVVSLSFFTIENLANLLHRLQIRVKIEIEYEHSDYQLNFQWIQNHIFLLNVIKVLITVSP